jgi:diguanylate cyclase (GGDEF)-like protein
MAGKTLGTRRGKAAGAAARRRYAVERKRTPAPAGAKSPAPKARSAAMRLAAEVDALKAQLSQARVRVAELETRVDEDPLTGLLNRRGFSRALERALAFVRRYGATAALVYLDLDHFKPINDRHGHAAGDWALGRAARLIAGSVRASDVAARVGGDEMAVLLWNVSEAQALGKARALEALIDSEPFEHKGKRLALGLSAGVAMLGADETVEAALARADEAMYARKRARRNEYGA